MWIKVENGLPPEGEYVIVLGSYLGDRAITLGKIMDGEWAIVHFLISDNIFFKKCIEDITHWMPLPLPEKKE